MNNMLHHETDFGIPAEWYFHEPLMEKAHVMVSVVTWNDSPHVLVFRHHRKIQF